MKNQHQTNYCCSICGKELKNAVKRRTENPLACSACLIVGVVDS
jgi:DNA-directed RNA polymerase subunit RPC12/RpoP